MLFNNSNSRIIKAIEQGESDKVRSLLSKSQINETDKRGRTILVLAANLGQLSTVKLLLGSGADVNLSADGGETPLMAAARHGFTAVIEALIAAGANVNAADKRGCTPLMLAVVWATRMASVGIADTASRVKPLLDAGANVNAADSKGRSAIMAQVRSGGGTLQEANRLPVLKLLLDAGGEVDSTGDKGRTPLMAAAFRGLKETFHLLLEAGANPYLHDASGRNALMHAAEGTFWTYRKAGYIDIFKTLIDLDIDLMEKNSSGMTALAIARRNKCKDLINLLVKAGAYD
jgi:ankyrin repeat protein